VLSINLQDGEKMLINISYQKKEAIYEQIVSEIERYVSLGILKPNEKIPSVRSLASDLGINPNTVKKAYDILESRGVIISNSTKGTYITDKIDCVKDKKINDIFEILESHILELEKLGLDRCEILKRLG